MSRKMKGTTMSLADFAGDAVKDSILPTESKGLEKADLPERPERGGFGSRRDFKDNDGEFKRGEREENKADEDTDWRGGMNKPVAPARAFAPSTEGRSFGATRPSAAADTEDDWRKTTSTPLPRTSAFSSSSRPTFDSEPNWRDAAPAAPVDERPAYLRNLKASLAARAPVGDQSRTVESRASPVTAFSSHSRSSFMSRTQTEPSRPVYVAKPPARDTVPTQAPSLRPKSKIDWEEDEVSAVVSKKEPLVDAEKLEGFVTRLTTLLSDESKKLESFAKKATDNFTAKELASNIPSNAAVRVALNIARGKDLDFVLNLCARVAPVFNALVGSAEMKLVLITQRICAEFGFPRLSPDCSLLEGFWLGLYESSVVSEATFLAWTGLENANYLEETAPQAPLDNSWGKATAMFQTQAFRDWLGAESEAKKAAMWDDSEDEDDEEVDAELGNYLDQATSRRPVGGLKKTISTAAARR